MGQRMILKPPRGAILNRTHPLARGLVGCWLFNEWTGNTARDSVSGLIATGVNAPTWDGMGMRFTAASNQYLTLNAISGFNPEKGTIYFRGVWDGPATSSKDYLIFSIYTSSTDRFFLRLRHSQQVDTQVQAPPRNSLLAMTVPPLRSEVVSRPSSYRVRTIQRLYNGEADTLTHGSMVS
jgi:hypothetical protein